MGFREFVKNIGRGLNRCIPKNKTKIIFESNSDYCDNSRALYDYMRTHGYGEQYRFVWCVSDVEEMEGKIPEAKLVSFKSKRGFLSYYLQMATSKYVVFSHYAPPFINPKSQTIVNLWHGTPLKTLKGHVPPASLFTYLLSPCDLFDPILADCFDASKEQLVQCGYPRNDLLFSDKMDGEKLPRPADLPANATPEAELLYHLGIDQAAYLQVLLWMPTFRRPVGGEYQDAAVTSTGLPLIDTFEQLQALNQKLMDTHLFLIIKLHPGQDLSGVRLVSLSNIKMLTNRELDEKHIQTYSLTRCADVLLTDYSSIYFDYLLLNRPIAFIVDDIGTYEKNRGFTVDDALSLMPGAKLHTIGELYEFLRQTAAGNDDYEGERHRVNALVNRFTDGNSCKRVAERFFGKL